MLVTRKELDPVTVLDGWLLWLRCGRLGWLRF
jgi:hypothetical protein